MEVPLMGTLNIFRFAASKDFLIAPETSGAFESPTPTLPFLSPTTTNAENRIVFPPLVFFEILLIWMTVSSNSLALPYLSIRILALLSWLLLLKILLFHDIYNRFYQKLFS